MRVPRRGSTGSGSRGERRRDPRSHDGHRRSESYGGKNAEERKLDGAHASRKREEEERRAPSPQHFSEEKRKTKHRETQVSRGNPVSREKPSAVTAPITYDSEVVTVASVSAVSGSSSSHNIVDVDTHRDEKKAEKKRVFRRKGMRIFVALLLVATVIWCIFFNPLWGLDRRNITVVGMGKDSVVSAKEIAGFVGKDEGVPITRLSMRTIGQDVMNVFPEVKLAEVSRSWRNGLRVNLTMRTPVACIVTAKGCSATDRAGYIFPVKEEIARNLPRIELPHGSEKNRQQSITTSAVDVLVSLNAQVRAMVSRITVDKNGRVSLVLTSGKTVIWGDMSRPDIKSQALKALINEPGATIDISEPTAAIVQ
ncbi:cell division protein FtsQ/DivIB [Actinotignum urinale]|uniref:Cell division protein FtsQ/DivIB n=1 Tax=Actinotignum urinale TaxID=190146 RepID=A0ABU5G6N1_9ACTO|nr:cell division protein FtsQ/DivIB [Actinotignum urinale]MDY5132310.1 cell division protein FtsQ/DivIB [Actinotignum urinale]WIK59193.1 cell division protein FtsQ/DivIB [Actinotignum urinale]